MNNIWNERYASDDYIYGTVPNLFFKEELDKLPAGKILLPAEGEGRQAIYAAVNKWNVTAFDLSKKGKEKAINLAQKNKVEIDYLIAGYEDVKFKINSFDAIALIYAHMPAEIRTIIHRKLISYLKPGGKLILEGFSKEQISYNSGGPRNIDMLYSEDELLEDFKDLNHKKISRQNIILDEGEFHKGEASVIRFSAIK